MEGFGKVRSGSTVSCLDWTSARHDSQNTMSYKSLNLQHCLCESMGWGLDGDKTRTDKWGIAWKLDGTMCRHTSLDGCWFLPQEHADHWGWKEKAAFGLDLGLEF